MWWPGLCQALEERKCPSILSASSALGTVLGPRERTLRTDLHGVERLLYYLLYSHGGYCRLIFYVTEEGTDASRGYEKTGFLRIEDTASIHRKRCISALPLGGQIQ